MHAFPNIETSSYTLGLRFLQMWIARMKLHPYTFHMIYRVHRVIAKNGAVWPSIQAKKAWVHVIAAAAMVTGKHEQHSNRTQWIRQVTSRLILFCSISRWSQWRTCRVKVVENPHEYKKSQHAYVIFLTKTRLPSQIKMFHFRSFWSFFNACHSLKPWNRKSWPNILPI